MFLLHRLNVKNVERHFAWLFLQYAICNDYFLPQEKPHSPSYFFVRIKPEFFLLSRPCIRYPISRNHLNLPVSRPRGVWFRTSLYAWKFSQRYQPLRPDDIFVGYWRLQPIIICRSEGIIGFFTCNISHYITFIFQHQFLLKSFRPSLTMISLKINNVTFPIVLRAL